MFNIKRFRLLLTLSFLITILFSSCLTRPVYKGVYHSIVYRAGKENYAAYRVPSLLYVDNVLLAFAEGRVYGFGDSGNIDLVLKRSTNGGKTWSDIQTIWDDGENSCASPTPVLIKRADGSKRILLLASWNFGGDHYLELKEQKGRNTRKVYSLYSDDLGLTWSQPVEITAQVVKSDWSWVSTGPSAGIQLEGGAFEGRVIIPCSHYSLADATNRVHLVYSDDEGESWKIGAIADNGSKDCQVIQKKTGDLLLNIRRDSKVFSEPYRFLAISSDGGNTLVANSYISKSEKIIDENQFIESDLKKSLLNEKKTKIAVTQFMRQERQLLSSDCQASVVRDSKSNCTWFSNPESEARELMTVKVSFDDGAIWNKKIVLWRKAAGYSSLAYDEGNWLFCLFENGKKFPYQEIMLSVIPYKLMENNGSNEVFPLGTIKK